MRRREPVEAAAVPAPPERFDVETWSLPGESPARAYVRWIGARRRHDAGITTSQTKRNDEESR